MTVENVFEKLRKENIYAYRFLAYLYAKKTKIPITYTDIDFYRFIKKHKCKIVKGLLTLYPYFANILPSVDLRRDIIFTKYYKNALIKKPYMSQKIKNANGIYFTEKEFKTLILKDPIFKILSLLFESKEFHKDLKREASNIIYTPLVYKLQDFYYLNTDPKRTKYFLNFEILPNALVTNYIGYVEYNNLTKIKKKFRERIKTLKETMSEISDKLIPMHIFFRGYVNTFFKNISKIGFQIGFITLNYIIVEDNSGNQRDYLSISLQYTPLIEKYGNKYYCSGKVILENKRYNKNFFNYDIPKFIIGANKFLNISSNEKVYLLSFVIVIFAEVQHKVTIYGPKKLIVNMLIDCLDKLIKH